jgi:Trypsin
MQNPLSNSIIRSRPSLTLGSATCGALCLMATSILAGCTSTTDDDNGKDRGGITTTIGNPASKTTFDRPAVGLIQIESANSLGVCTGTLVGKRTVLTAAHCGDGLAERTFYADFDAKTYVKAKVIRIEKAPGYVPVPDGAPDARRMAQSDVAIFTLDADLPGVTPIPIAIAVSKVGFFETLTGYGKTSRTADDAGVGKRQTRNFVREVSPKYLTFKYAANVFGLSCNGDSGGPALRFKDGQESITAVTSAGNCTENSLYARVDNLTEWIRKESGGDALFTK